MNSRLRHILRWLPGLAMALYATAATAAPEFIESTRVEAGAVYTDVTLKFRCNFHYVGHDPAGLSDVLRIQIEPTTVCTGAPPSVALARQLHRPRDADKASIDLIEYDGQSLGSESLRVSFTRDVRFDVRSSNGGNTLTIRVFEPSRVDAPEAVDTQATPRSTSRLVRNGADAQRQYVINIASMNRRPVAADIPELVLAEGSQIVVAEAMIDGASWYRIQVGYFDTAEAAARELRELREHYAGAWIGYAGDDEVDIPMGPASGMQSRNNDSTGSLAANSDEILELMAEGRRAMTAGELSRAVQIYTKVLQQPGHEYLAEAQEYLALARERNGQIAHAKAEYERYLELYADTDGATRVQQRLAALLATGPAARPQQRSYAASRANTQSRARNWTLRSYVSQYYRRDTNQVNDQDEIVNQSSIYSDVNLDARRRGERFDVSARITAGYRHDLLSEEDQVGSGNDFRLSYAYLDVADARTGVRGRLGRQTRNTGGVLGRFDGLNLSYSLNDQIRFETVAGQPVYSTSDDLPDSRAFVGVSSTFSPFGDGLDFGAFVLQQDIEGLTDRQVVGAEMRYFGERRSLWGILSYDTEFSELGSAFVQGSWRLPGNFTVSGLIDIRRSPFLSLGNALVGQQTASFEDLKVLFTESELRQFALDRSPEVKTFSAGISKPLTPKLQMNLNANISAIASTPESAGVAATESTEYSYYSGDLVASGLFREGDVAILGLRYSASDTTDVYSVNLDARFPIGKAWRINPRLRVDYREIQTDQSTQWIYSPALRIQYRPDRRWRLELSAGKQFSYRDMESSDMDRESDFIHLGYQFFY